MTVAKAKGSKSPLREFLGTKKVDTRLIGAVERHILTRPLDDSRRTDVLHPSDLVKADYCMRAGYYQLIGVPAPADRPALKLQSVFDEGHAVHAKWQRYLQEMGVLYGQWVSPTYSGWAVSLDVPPDAEYREVPLKDDELRISGHSDGWVKGMGDDFLIEIKSIGPGTIRMEQPSLFKDGGDLFSAWRDLREPFPTHVRQGQLYLALAHRMVENGLLSSAPNEIVFIYELKADQSYKEFPFQFDPFLSKNALDDAREVIAAVNAGEPPECVYGGCKRCKPFEEV